MKRDGLSFKAAVQSLGAWDERYNLSHQQAQQIRQERDRKREAEEASLAAHRHKLLEAREWLHFVECLYDEESARLSDLRQGSPEQFAGEEEACWEFLSLALPEIRRAEAEYLRLAEVKL
jgi:hypothetical protein